MTENDRSEIYCERTVRSKRKIDATRTDLPFICRRTVTNAWIWAAMTELGRVSFKRKSSFSSTISIRYLVQGWFTDCLLPNQYRWIIDHDEENRLATLTHGESDSSVLNLLLISLEQRRCPCPPLVFDNRTLPPESTKRILFWFEIKRLDRYFSQQQRQWNIFHDDRIETRCWSMQRRFQWMNAAIERWNGPRIRSMYSQMQIGRSNVHRQ